jgi:hypothetical protein
VARSVLGRLQKMINHIYELSINECVISVLNKFYQSYCRTARESANRNIIFHVNLNENVDDYLSKSREGYNLALLRSISENLAFMQSSIACASLCAQVIDYIQSNLDGARVDDSLDIIGEYIAKSSFSQAYKDEVMEKLNFIIKDYNDASLSACKQE